MSLEQFVQSKIMEPIKMNNSYCSADMKKGNNFAMPHTTETENDKIKQISLFKEIINGAAVEFFQMSMICRNGC